jgi:HSP20 family protein
VVPQIRATRREERLVRLQLMPERDLYAWARTTYVSRRSRGFTPNVDVYYCGEPQQAVVKVDLSGVELSAVGIEISGRQLAIVGERPVQETEGRVYQQVEIPSGPFRRIVELQVDVDAERAKATYEDGVLRIELPLRDPAENTRRVPIGRD